MLSPSSHAATSKHRCAIAARRAGGFTLIELVSVIIILGILLATAVPRFWNNAPFHEMGYANEVAAAIRYSQKIAAASGCQVRFNVTAANYSAVQLTACTAGTWTQPVLFADGSAVIGTPPSSANVGAAAQLTFDRAGLLVAAAGTPIQIGPHQVQVAAISGLVTVQ